MIKQQTRLFADKPKRRPLPNTNLNSGERTLRWLRTQGWIPDVCERWIPIFTTEPIEEVGYCSECKSRVVVLIGGKGKKPRYIRGVRKDVYGLADLIAFKINHPAVALVQSTSKPDMARHLREYKKDPEKRELLLGWIGRPGRKFLILGWQRYEVSAKKGGTKVQWDAEERWVKAEDLELKI